MQHVLSSGAEYVQNMSVHATWTDEDFIGRIARISPAHTCAYRCNKHAATSSWSILPFVWQTL